MQKECVARGGGVKCTERRLQGPTKEMMANGMIWQNTGVRGTLWWCETYGEVPPRPCKRDDGKWDDLAKHRSAWHVVVV